MLCLYSYVLSLPSVFPWCTLEVISLVLGWLLPEIAGIFFFFFLVGEGMGGVSGIWDWMGDDISLNISLNEWSFAGCRLLHAYCRGLAQGWSGEVRGGKVVI